MSETVLQLEASIRELPREEQLWLLERIAHWLRESETAEHARWVASLDEMAHDPDIQRENQIIAREFAVTESDGLEGL
ncbi:MAG TPA: hypothetical protein VFD70_23095 [Anaerolineae bacterium]|nr:hypothetical protein [Anaerolineae bacterium]